MARFQRREPERRTTRDFIGQRIIAARLRQSFYRGLSSGN